MHRVVDVNSRHLRDGRCPMYGLRTGSEWARRRLGLVLHSLIVSLLAMNHRNRSPAFALFDLLATKLDIFTRLLTEIQPCLQPFGAPFGRRHAFFLIPATFGLILGPSLHLIASKRTRRRDPSPRRLKQPRPSSPTARYL